MLRTPLRLVVAVAASVSVSSMLHAETADQILARAGSIGITPGSCVIAGLDETMVSLLLTRCGQVEADWTTLEDHFDEIAVQSSIAAELAEHLVHHSEDGAVAQQHSAALAEMAFAQAQADTLREQIFQEITDGLSASEVAVIDEYASTLSFNVPESFRAASLAEAEWQAIAYAIRAETRSHRMGTDLAEPQAQLLSAIRAEPQVMAADAALAAGLTGMTMYMQTTAAQLAE